MNVLLIGETAGGEGTYVRSLVNHGPDGISWSYLFRDERNIPETVRHYAKLERLLNLIRARVIGTGLHISLIKIKEPYDLIHLHGFATKVINKSGKDIPIVFSASGNLWQGILDFRNWSKFKFYRASLSTKILYKLTGITDRIHNAGNVSRLIVWSDYAKGVYLKFGVPEKKIVVIPPGFRIPEFESKKRDDGVTLLFIAGKNAFARKGGHLLIRTFRELKKVYSNIHLTCVGEIPVLEEQTTDVEFLGQVSLGRLYREVYPQADILVLPTYADGFPTVCAEAQGFGIPVVSTNIWAIPEIVIHSETGFLIPPGDQESLMKYLSLLIEDERLRANMSKSARKHFWDKFSIEKTNELLKGVYCEVTER